MNLLLLQEGDRVPGERHRFRVTGARARHLREVLRAEEGRALRVGLLEGPLGEAEVSGWDGDAAELVVRFEAAPPERPRLDLVLAMPRPKVLRRMLPELASFGVDRIVLLNTWRVAKPYFAATVLEPAEYRPLLHEGMMQGRTTREPLLRVEPLFRPYVEDRVAAEFEGSLRLLAHPPASGRLADLGAIDAARRVVLAVGPEGGFIPFEVELLRARGFEAVSLGPRVLRVETATIALLAQLDLLRSLG